MIRLQYLLFAIMLCACAGKSGDTSSVPDTTQIELDANSEMDSDVPPYQERLDKHLEGFDLARNTFPRITFQSSAEMGSRTVNYYIDNNELAWVGVEESGEGGYESTLVLNLTPGWEVSYYKSSEEDGFFTFNEEGKQTKYVVESGMGSHSESNPAEYKQEYLNHLETIIKNKSRFKLNEGLYSLTTVHEKYQGEYGSAEKNESYQITEELMASNLLAKEKINADLIGGYLNLWYPLYEEADGKLVRHTRCDVETVIHFKIEVGRYIWMEEGYKTDAEYTITGFDEGEGDAIYVTLQNKQGTFKKIIVFNDSEDLLHIDGKIFTANPKNFNIINEASNCY